MRLASSAARSFAATASRAVSTLAAPKPSGGAAPIVDGGVGAAGGGAAGGGAAGGMSSAGGVATPPTLVARVRWYSRPLVAADASVNAVVRPYQVTNMTVSSQRGVLAGGAHAYAAGGSSPRSPREQNLREMLLPPECSLIAR